MKEYDELLKVFSLAAKHISENGCISGIACNMPCWNNNGEHIPPEFCEKKIKRYFSKWAKRTRS